MSKIKIKTKRGAVKRFKKIANGYKRKRAFTSHILTKMKQKRKRNLRSKSLVFKGELRALNLMLPN